MHACMRKAERESVQDRRRRWRGKGEREKKNPLSLKKLKEKNSVNNPESLTIE